jgi:NDP-sugar pyrophosphorylase family protein
MKAMILAAGKGTRLLPHTAEKPKALIEIQGVSLLEHTIRYLMHFGVDSLIINVHHQAPQVIEFLKSKNYFNIRIEISDEQDNLLDTGGGLVKSGWFFDDGRPFILTACDVITDLDLLSMYRFHLNNNPLATLAVKHRKSSRDLLFDNDYRLCGWHNNLNGKTRWVKRISMPNKAAFSAIHVIDPAFFDLVKETGVFSLTDVYLRLASDHVIKGFLHDESLWFEAGRIENVEEMNRSKEIQVIYNKLH